jgi:hypothetical protein
MAAVVNVDGKVGTKIPAGMVHGDERKRTSRRRIESYLDDVKTKDVGVSWDQNGRHLFTAIRHPVYRRRDCVSGFCGERGKL